MASVALLLRLGPCLRLRSALALDWAQEQVRAQVSVRQRLARALCSLQEPLALELCWPPVARSLVLVGLVVALLARAVAGLLASAVALPNRSEQVELVAHWETSVRASGHLATR